MVELVDVYDLSMEELNEYNLDTSIMMNEKLFGTILCEGAQGFDDINYGNYPYVTSSSTLTYSACSLGFSPNEIRTFMVLLRFMILAQALIDYFKKATS